MSKTGGLNFTDAFLRAAPPAPPGQRRELIDSGCPGLRLRIDERGRKVFSVMRSVGDGPNAGKRVRVTLRPAYPSLSLAQARRKALQMLARIDNGDMPQSPHRRAAAAADGGFATQWDLYSRIKQGELRARSYAEIERPFRRSFLPAWGSRAVDAITRADIADLLDQLQLTRGIVTRNRAQAALTTFFAWLVDRGRLAASPIAGMKRAAGERARDRVLSDGEIAALWAATSPTARWPATRPGDPDTPAHPVFAALLRVLLLTGQRLGEVAGMRWDELAEDAGGMTWRIPGARYKTKVAHEVPISAAVRAILAARPRLETVERVGDGERLAPSPFVFTTRGPAPFSGEGKLKPILDQAMRAQLHQAAREAGIDPVTLPSSPWTIHDLRRTARTLLQRAGVPYDVGEAVIGHKVPGVAGVYARHSFATEKRAALDTLAATVLSIAAPRGAAKRSG